jgi:O-antigen/teichoic acid export membrane protein
MTGSSSRIVTGFGWVALISYVNRGLSFATTLVLVKFLAPADFGLFGIATMLIVVLELFKDIGLEQALIYRQPDDDFSEACITSFWLIIGLNMALCMVGLIIAPFAAKFYENRMVAPVIMLLSSNMIWNSIRAVPTTLISKNADFQKLVIPEIIPEVVASTVSIVMAVQGYGVWSLVIKSSISSFMGMVLIWKYSPFRPKLLFNSRNAKELLSYGKFIFGASIILVILYNIDMFYVSKVIGLAALGLYTMAMTITNMPISELSHLAGRVMFPVFSKMNQESQVLKRMFLKTLKYVGMISIPLAFGLATYGPALIASFYGEKWLGMVEPLSILPFYALFRSLSTINNDLFKAIGKPKLVQKFAITRLIAVGIMGVPSLMGFGIKGICTLIVCTYGLVFFAEVRTICNLYEMRAFDMLKIFILPILGSSIIIPGTYYLLNLTASGQNLPLTLAGVGTSILTYFIYFLTFDKQTFLDLKKIFGIG